MEKPPLIGIITDFGMRGMHYIAEMKGVALSICPEVSFLDISHTITPFSTLEAAYVLYTVYDSLPKGSIIVSVVDPGVGSERDIVALQTLDGYIFIGPDNGLFSYFANRELIAFIVKITEIEFYNPAYAEALKIVEKRQSMDKDRYVQQFNIDPFSEDNPKNEIYSDELPSAINLEESESFMADYSSKGDMENEEINLTPITSTFHGRDIMMPIAAHLADGLDIFSVGEPKDTLDVIFPTDPEISEDKQFIFAFIQYVDDFGNLITNIPIVEFQMLTFGKPCSYHLYIEERNYSIKKTPTFAGNPPETLLLIDGSSGFLEICLNQSRADHFLKLTLGSKVKLEILGALFSEFTGLPS